MDIDKLIWSVIGYFGVGIIFAYNFSGDNDRKAMAWMVLYPILFVTFVMFLIGKVLWLAFEGFFEILIKDFLTSKNSRKG